MIRAVSIEMSDLLGPLLGRAHERLRAQVDAVLAAHDLHARQFGALVVLAAEGPLSQRRLGDVQGVDRTTTVAVVDALEARGLVERRRDVSDRRVRVVALTADGRRALRSAQRDVLRAEGRFLAAIGPDGDHLRSLLRRLLDEPTFS
jgi:DNA-binding MarR family transcriptional regulator